MSYITLLSFCSGADCTLLPNRKVHSLWTQIFESCYPAAPHPHLDPSHPPGPSVPILEKTLPPPPTSPPQLNR